MAREAGGLSDNTAESRELDAKQVSNWVQVCRPHWCRRHGQSILEQPARILRLPPRNTKRGKARVSQTHTAMLSKGRFIIHATNRWCDMVAPLSQKLDTSLFLRKIARQPPTERHICVYCEPALSYIAPILLCVRACAVFRYSVCSTKWQVEFFEQQPNQVQTDTTGRVHIRMYVERRKLYKQFELSPRSRQKVVQNAANFYWYRLVSRW